MTAVLERANPTDAAPGREPRRTVPMLSALPPLLVMIVIIVYPLLRVLSNSADGEGNSTWMAVLTSTLFQRALVSTAQIAVLTTIGLVAALFSEDGFGDLLAGVCLAVPVAVGAWYGWVKR